ncbi:MAG: beta-ketoacyl-ACP synthase II [Chloroflexi bacterium]|nr:beta-ketoacyl-ACP synthase II [Chloroflexota bacterium]
MNKRVVVTGMGVICPVGNDVTSAWAALVRGESGIGRITRFDATGFETQIAGEVKGFDPVAYMGAKEARRMDRFTQLAVAAAYQALEYARLSVAPENAYDIGVLVGSGIGGIGTLSDQIQVLNTRGPGRISPFLVPMMISDMASGQISISLGLKGPNLGVVSACSTSAHALGEATEIIKRGDAEVMVAGGSEAAVVPIGIAGFTAMKALSTRNDEPEKASRPFDAKRDGFVLGEGAAVVILESLSYAEKRGAPILAEVVGYGSTADASHITAPAEDGEGAARAMMMAMKRAGLEPHQIDYLNAHGTSTPLNEKCETLAIKWAFGDYAYQLPVSSTKSMTGHLLGAAGALEAAVCIEAIRNGVIPPTINYEFPDPDCDLDWVPNVARTQQVRTAMSNSFGFGGHNVSLIFSRYDGA